MTGRLVGACALALGGSNRWSPVDPALVAATSE